MEWGLLWTILAVVISVVVTWVIARWKLSDQIKDIIKNLDKIVPAILKIYNTTVGAFRPDEDGTVRLTVEEINAIKDAVAELLALFGIELPFEVDSS